MLAALKIICIFVVVLFLLQKKISLGWSLLGVSLFLLIFSGFNPLGWWRVVSSTFWPNPDNLALLLSVIFVTLLGGTLAHSGELDVLTRSVQKVLKRPELAGVILPSLVGILPMPGGALFSAPLVKTAATPYTQDGDILAFANYWFRHIWEFFLPLYPGVLLAASVSGLPATWIMTHHFPFFLIAAGAGWLAVKRHLQIPPPEKTRRFAPDMKNLLFVLLPFMVPVASVLLGIPVWIGAILGIATFSITKRLPLKTLGKFLARSFPWAILFDVIGVLIFKNILLANQDIDKMASFLISKDVPLLLLGMLLPMVTGLLTGLTAAFVGIAFPMVLSFFNAQTLPSVFPILYLSGFSGVLLSPMHLCFIFSCRFFEASFKKVYRLLIPTTLTLFAWGIIWSMIS
jgi:hypothetical protein